MKRDWLPQLIASGMLFWALTPGNPYGYYVLLRWVCCAVFAFVAVKAHTRKQYGWTWTLGVAAAIFNPIVPLHLDRELWMIVDLLAILIVLKSMFDRVGVPIAEPAAETTPANAQSPPSRPHPYMEEVTS